LSFIIKVFGTVLVVLVVVVLVVIIGLLEGIYFTGFAIYIIYNNSNKYKYNS